jgi:hypothetical protein
MKCFGTIKCLLSCVAEPRHFYAAPALGENFNAAQAAPVPTYYKAKQLLKMNKTLYKGGVNFFLFFMIKNVVDMKRTGKL